MLVTTGMNNSVTKRFTNMTLRELMIERILYAIDDETLRDVYNLSDEELMELSDIDLFELFEDAIMESL